MSALSLQAKERLNYTIVNSYWDHSVSKDSLFISGKVNYRKKPDLNSFGKVAALNFKTANIVGRSGDYSIKISRSAKGFYFFQEGYREVVINLSAYADVNHFEIDIAGIQYFEMIQVEKPVIYLYHDTPIKTELSLSPIGDLIFTYPQYESNWQIETQKNGSIKNLKTGKVHPYLFWEATQKTKTFNTTTNGIEGYIIQTDSAVTFLENQLDKLGLNATESTDFITYWGPRLMVKKYATIQFLVNENYTAFFGRISSSTALDYQLRIGMLFKVSDEKPKLKVSPPTPRKQIKRHGFSLIEWGGIELKNNSKLL